MIVKKMTGREGVGHNHVLHADWKAPNLERGDEQVTDGASHEELQGD